MAHMKTTPDITDDLDWLSEWLKHSLPGGRPGPTAREIVIAGRDRLSEKRRADH
jgi:hypothetical protein